MRLITALIALSMLVVACGSPGAETESTEPERSEAAGPTESEPAPTDDAAAAPDFSGQTIRMVVPYGEGGTFDALARLVAEKMSQNLPGQPTIFVDNVSGGGGLLGISEVANASELTLGHFSGVLALKELLGLNEGVSFQELEVIGSGGGTTRMLATAGGIGLDDLRGDGEPVRFGGQGIGTGLDDAVLLAKGVAGLDRIQVVSGYDGQNEIYLAMQQGEVQGGPASIQDSLPTGNATFHEMLQADEAQFIVRVGGNETLEGVPSLAELVEDEADLPLVEAFDGMYTGNRVFVASPGVDDATLAALRDAFEQAINDPELVSVAEERGFDIVPVIGQDAEVAFRRILDLDADAADRLREILLADQ